MSELVVRLSAEDRVAIVHELADELSRRGLAPAPPATATMLTLDEFAADLSRRMPARTVRQWRKWLYDAAPRGRIPGARKVAARWWFPASVIDDLLTSSAGS